MLRSILQRIFVAVREAANGLNEVWGPTRRDMPGYREALIETAVCVNAAQAAFDLHVEVERAGKWEIEVLYGVYNLFTHQVSMPNELLKGAPDLGTHLAMAPTNPREFSSVAIQVARRLLQNQQGGAGISPVQATPSPGVAKNGEEVPASEAQA